MYGYLEVLFQPFHMSCKCQFICSKKMFDTASLECLFCSLCNVKVTCLSMKLQLNSIGRHNFFGIPKYSPLGQIFMHIPVQGPVLKLNLKMEFQFVSIF